MEDRRTRAARPLASAWRRAASAQATWPVDRRLPSVGPCEVVEVAEELQLWEQWARDVRFGPVAGLAQHARHRGDAVRKREPEETTETVLEGVEAR